MTNGDFETGAVPQTVTDPLKGTPADECIGIGHQARWGDDSPRGALTGNDSRAIIFGGPSNADPSAKRLVDRYDDDPAGQAEEDAREQSGYGHCEFSEKDGWDVAWFNPARTTGPAFWSNVDDIGSPTRSGFGFDDDPFDREVQVEANASKDKHNLWQVLLNGGRHPAWSANFSALEFDVENGSIPSNARVDYPVSEPCEPAGG